MATAVVSDTSPINYLVQIGHESLLESLFGGVLIGPVVFEELNRPQTPETVRRWIASRPPCIVIDPKSVRVATSPTLRHAGERETIELAVSTGASLVLMDDRRGLQAARARGLRVVGTLGVLYRAAQRNLVDVNTAVDRLRATNFRIDPIVLARLLTQRTDDGIA